eukprot:SAG31_NODE_6922_length_1849_cov_1.511429_2_plen_172_part_00
MLSLLLNSLALAVQTAGITVLPYLCNIPAAALSGCAADWLAARTSVLTARKLCNSGGFALSALAWLCVPTASNSASALSWLCAALALHVVAYGGFEATKLDIAAPEQVGLMQSLINTLANTSGLTAVPFAAFIVEAPDLGGWNGVFYMIAALFGLSMLLYLRWARQDRVFY